MASYKKKTYQNIQGVPITPCYVLDMSVEQNTTYPLPMLKDGNHYFFLGEVDQAPGHFIVFDMTEGKILKGMFELYRFRLPTDEEF